MEVQCRFYTFKGKFNWFTDPYTCEVTEVLKASLEKEIKFNGIHKESKTNSDVEWLQIAYQPIGFVPKNLHEVFPNLKFIDICYCGLKKISREDLKGLEDLEYIDLSKNKLISLPDDLFVDMKKLRCIFFDGNQLERLSSNLLKPIESTLEYADFGRNTRIDDSFCIKCKDKKELAKLMKTIDSNCWPPGSRAYRMFAEFEKFKTSCEFADFAIKVRGKEFKIHKMIFAAQSSVFRKIFTEDVEEVSKTFNKIKNFGEKTFEHFLDYFYTGKVDAAARATEMFELASEFDVPDLKRICTARILETLDESNAVDVFNLSHRQSSDELKRKSFEVIRKMFPDLDASFENKLHKVNDLVALKAQMDAIMKEK